MSKPQCANFFNCTQTNDYNHKQACVHFCKWDKQCRNKNDVVHLTRFLHTCSAEPCLATDALHQSTFIHLCMLANSCPGTNDITHMRQNLHKCPNGTSCTNKTDATHRDFYLHPCEVSHCNNTEAYHRHIYSHPCSYGTTCKDTTALHHFSFYHASFTTKELFAMKELPTTDAAYQTVLNAFKNTGGTYSQISIYRIENPTLFQKFVATVEVISKLRGTTPTISSLFHGSSEEAIQEIMKRGFDPQLSKTGCAIGIGTYFAKNASYSNGYAKVAADGWKRMYYAKVLIGRSGQGASGMHHAPKHSDGSYYESVCENPSNPTIWCVFDPTQAYPEYLIKYK